MIGTPATQAAGVPDGSASAPLSNPLERRDARWRSLKEEKSP